MELERIRFSIIIGAYETNAVFFRQGLSSACAIKWKNLEIHVLDACPGAGLDEVTRQTAGDDYRVSYHRIRPRGSLADVFNAGIGMARGDYLIFLGLTDRLNTMILRYLSDHPGEALYDRSNTLRSWSYRQAEYHDLKVFERSYNASPG